MSKKFYFFSTREVKNLYNFIVPVACNHAEKITKKDLDIIYPKKYFPSFQFISFIFKILINGVLLNDKKFIYCNYSGFLIGRYVLSHAMRYTGYYKNRLTFLFNKFKYLIVVDKIVQNILNIPPETKAVYVDHGMYLNGIYFQGFQKKKLIIYTNNYPKGFCSFDFRKYKGKIIQYSNLMALKKNVLNASKKNEVKKKLKLITNKTSNIPWMKNANFLKMKKIKNLKRVTHLIYVHSFLETQYMYGYDGFISYEEWLEYSIDHLIKRDNFIIVKAHPSFFVRDLTNFNAYDLSIFNKIKDKYSSNKKIIFIDYPLQNLHLLKKISKKTVIISRHSTAIIEAVYLGFKIIASSENFWDTKKLTLCNTWYDLKEYKKILFKSWSELFYSKKNDLLSVSYDLFCRKSFSLGRDYFIKLISKNYNIPIDQVEFKIKYKLKNKKKLKKIQNQILKNSISIEIF